MHLAGRVVEVLAIFLISCTSVGGSSQVTAAPADPANMTYRSAWRESGSITLAGGTFREPAAPGSAAEFSVTLTDRQAFGPAGGGEAGAVILVTQAGGTGSFYDLALLVREGGRWGNSDVLALGDRVDVHSLEFRDGVFVIDMTTHGPQDPSCCPTQRVIRRFTVRDGKLVEQSGETEGLVGTSWQWVHSLYNDDSKSVPKDPGQYVVAFAGDGTVSVKADCNMKGGTYRLDGKSVAIDITHSTMAMCPPETLEDKFVRDLAGATIWFFRDGDLYLDLKYDTGTMRFSRKSDAAQ